MKLIFCPHCEDIRKLQRETTRCTCGRSYGHYCKDWLHACYGGEAVPLGFDNTSFSEALRQRPLAGLGKRFEAFVIPRQCPTLRYLGVNI